MRIVVHEHKLKVEQVKPVAFRSMNPRLEYCRRIVRLGVRIKNKTVSGEQLLARSPSPHFRAVRQTYRSAPDLHTV